MYRTRTHKAGFTIIELLMVVAIIGVISAVVLFSIDESREKARDSQRRADMKSVVNALELYVTDYGIFPPHGGNQYGCDSSSCLAVLTDELVDGGYVSSIPVDPSHGNTSNGYRYCRVSNTRQYALIMQLESSGSWCNVGSASQPTGTACWYTNGTPNYGYCRNQ